MSDPTENTGRVAYSLGGLTVDEIGFIQIATLKTLTAVASGKLDLNRLALEELASRGMNHQGVWVGFAEAKAILDAHDANGTAAPAVRHRTVAVPQDARGWGLYCAAGDDAVAQQLTDRLTALLHDGVDADAVRASMYELMAAHKQFGAFDTEPRAILDRVIAECEDARQTIENAEGDVGGAPKAITSLEDAQEQAVALLLPFLSKGEDGELPEDVLANTLGELVPRYASDRSRFLTPEQRDVLIRSIVDQKKRWESNDGTEIADMVIHGYWGYCDATDSVLLERGLGESPSIIELNPEYYSADDIETIQQLLGLPQSARHMGNHEASFRDDIQNVIESVQESLKRRKAPRGRG